MSMAAYLTSAGLTVLNKVIAAHGPLIFTKAELGSGVCTGEAACRARTSLVNKVADATLVSARLEGGEAKISAQYINAGLVTGFFVNEVGIYVQDPDSSAQVLYCYATFGDGTTPDWIAPASSAIYTRTYDIATIISGVSSVQIMVSPSALVSQKDFEAFAESVDSTMLAIAIETSAECRRANEHVDNLETALRTEMSDRDDQYARNENTTLLAIMAQYDAVIRNLQDRLTTAEAQIAAIGS